LKPSNTRDILSQGYLSGEETSLFEQARSTHSLDRIEAVQEHFAQSAINALYTAKREDAKAAPSSQEPQS
jgi:hypothetical protein